MEQAVTFTNALVFDGVSDDLDETTIHVENGNIVAIGGRPPSGNAVLDLNGRFVSPGLIDAHCHAYGWSLDLLRLETSPLSYTALKARQRLEASLRRGFTTIRDVAGGDIGIQQAIDEDLIKGPRYLFTGRALSQTGGHVDPRPPESHICVCSGHMGEVVDGVDSIRKAVRERLRTGAHAIKIMASGGVVSPSDPLGATQYSAEEIRAATEEAARRDSYVAAHAYSPAAIVHAVSNGVRTVEHGNLLDQPAAALIAEAGAFLVPTLVTYDAMERRGAELGLPKVAQEKNAAVRAAGLESIGIAKAADVSIGFGTDLMGDLEDDQLLEFKIRVEVETVADVLRSATSVNADLLGRADLGRIKPGAVADLVVYASNPFRDASALWSSDREVFRSGRRVG